LLETVAIAVLGISLAVVLALPLSVLAASPSTLSPLADRPGPVRRLGQGAARLVLNLMRSIPELIWALIFVRVVGLGPAAGVLAIGIGYAGVLGKVFAEIFESLPKQPAEGLAAVGASPLKTFIFGVLPASMPLLGSYTLYRFDCAIRASAILGLVGAGGLGLQLELSLKMFSYDEVAALVIALFLLVASVDLASRLARRKLQQSSGLLRRSLSVRLVGVGSWMVACLAAAVFLRFPISELLSLEAVKSIGSFASAMFPPDLSPAFLASIGPAVVETLSISVLGTAIAAVLGMGLAYLVAAGHRPSEEVPGGGRRLTTRVWVNAASWMARALLNLCRTLPELLWALLFIFVVGLGPFAGALALGMHTAGVLGRLYSEVLEEVPSGPSSALRLSGATPSGVAIFAVLPQAFPQLIAYTLYRWEVNIRASAILGVVGAGGLGKALLISLSLFHHHRTLTLVGVVVAMVAGVDLLSGWLRRRVQESGTHPAQERAGEWTGPSAASATAW
jgi:phosphonate transport system permease protein